MDMHNPIANYPVAQFEFAGVRNEFLTYNIINWDRKVLGSISGNWDIRKSTNTFESRILDSAIIISKNNEIGDKTKRFDVFYDNEFVGILTCQNNATYTYDFFQFKGTVTPENILCYDYTSFSIQDEKWGNMKLLLSQPQYDFNSLIIRLISLKWVIDLLKLKWLKKSPFPDYDPIFRDNVPEEFMTAYFIITSFYRCCVLRWDDR